MAFAADTSSVQVNAGTITFVEDARVARAGTVSMALVVDAHSVCADISSMTFAMVASRAHGWAVLMALAVEAILANAGAGQIAYQVDSPTTRAEVVSR